MKVAGISVDKEAMPTKEQFIKMALASREYANYDKPEALGLINKEIKAHGLYKSGTDSDTKQLKPIAEPVSEGIDKKRGGRS